jgi:hypothetical protein
MAHHDTSTDATEPADRQPRSLQKPDPSTAVRPAWAMTELIRNAIASPDTVMTLTASSGFAPPISSTGPART